MTLTEIRQHGFNSCLMAFYGLLGECNNNNDRSIFYVVKCISEYIFSQMTTIGLRKPYLEPPRLSRDVCCDHSELVCMLTVDSTEEARFSLNKQIDDY